MAARVKGLVKGMQREMYMFVITDAEGRRLMLNSWQMGESGYGVKARSECVAELTYGEYHETIVCAGSFPRPATAAPPTIAAAPAASTTPAQTTLTIVPDSEYPARPWRTQ